MSQIGISPIVSVHSLGETVINSTPPAFFNVNPFKQIASLWLPLAIKYISCVSLNFLVKRVPKYPPTPPTPKKHIFIILKFAEMKKLE
jgi:hypothetical protein